MNRLRFTRGRRGVSPCSMTAFRASVRTLRMTDSIWSNWVGAKDLPGTVDQPTSGWADFAGDHIGAEPPPGEPCAQPAAAAPMAPVPGRRAGRGGGLSRPGPAPHAARSARSCWPWPTPRAGTKRTGWPCSATRPAGRASADLRTRLLGLLARRFGSVFVLALAQRAEVAITVRGRRRRHGHHGRRRADPRGGGARPGRPRPEPALGHVPGGGVRRQRRPGQQPVPGRSAVSASGVANQIVLLTGLAGLLAGALSMGAGEYVSVRSQRELLEASTPDPEAQTGAAPARHRRQRAGAALPRPGHGPGRGRGPR